MTVDRRRGDRVDSGRRRSDRIRSFRPARWRVGASAEVHRGWLIDASAHGMALLAEARDTPAIGESVHPLDDWAIRGRRAIVARIERQSALLNLVGLEFIEPHSPHRRRRQTQARRANATAAS